MTQEVRPRRPGPRRARDERGVVAGSDGLAVGVLVLVAGTVLVVNAWSVVSTRAALDAAAWEYLRAWTTAPSALLAPVRADEALHRSLDAAGTTPLHLEVDGPDPAAFGPCAEATVVVRARVPAARAPFLGTLASSTVEVRHADLVPPHRELVTGDRYDPSGTPCGG